MMKVVMLGVMVVMVAACGHFIHFSRAHHQCQDKDRVPVKHLIQFRIGMV